MTAFELVAKLILDKSDYDESLGDAEEEASGFGSRLKSGLKTAAGIGATALKAVTAGTGQLASALMTGVTELGAYGDGVDKASQKLGISAEAYQEWDAILQHSGTSMSAMTGTFHTLANVTQGASDKQVDALNKLGLSLEDVAEMSTEDLFGTIIEQLQGMEEGTERSYIATQLLGRGSVELGALLNTSAEDTRAMRNRVHELGGVLSDEGVKNAAAFQDEMQDMQTALQGAKRNIMEEFLPAFSSGMHLVQDIATSGMFGGLADKVGDIFEHIVGILENTLMPAVERLWPTISRIIDDALELLDSIMPVLNPIVDAVVWALEQVILPLVGSLIDGITTFVNIITGDFSAAVKDLETASNDLATAQEKLADAQDWLVTSTDKLKSSQEKLAEIERETGRSGEDIAQRIEDGRLKYEDLDVTLQNLYKAYLDNQRAVENLRTATEELEQAKQEEKIATLEVERALAEEQGTLEEFANSVIDAYERGELSLEQTQMLIEEALTGMSMSAESAFLQTIPDAIREGLDPLKYETDASYFKKTFVYMWEEISAGAMRLGEDILTGFIIPLNNNITELCNAIGNAFSGAWNAITGVFVNAYNWFLDNVIMPIANAWDWLLGKFTGENTSAKADAFTSKSRAKTIPHMASGGVLQRGQIGLLEGNGAEAVVPLENNERWISAVARDMSRSMSDFGGNVQIQRELLEAIRDLKGLRVVMDTGETVGALASPMNGALGDQYTFRRRGIV